MNHTFHIDDSSKEGKALVNLLNTLSFVKKEGLSLTDEHLSVVRERKEKYVKGESSAKDLDQILEELNAK
jgi:hypothetical protein